MSDLTQTPTYICADSNLQVLGYCYREPGGNLRRDGCGWARENLVRGDGELGTAASTALLTRGL